MKFADLHLHSLFSDGTFTPEEIASRAKASGLATISLTDHDTVEGCARLSEACDALEIEFISGTELTTEHGGHELHLLGYFVDIHNEQLLTEISKSQIVRQNRIREMVAELNKLNIPLDAEDVFAIANCKSPGRPHVARALVKAGLVKTLDEAFERYLKIGRPAWVPKKKVLSSEAIQLIHQAGGLAVMAHPGLNRTDDVIPDLVKAGLDGIECYHTKHSKSVSGHYREMAAHFNLLVTGGSDCHGMNKGRPLIGTVKLDHVHVDKLKAKVAERKLTPTHAHE